MAGGSPLRVPSRVCTGGCTLLCSEQSLPPAPAHTHTHTHTHTPPQGCPRLKRDSQGQAQSSRGQQVDAPSGQVWGLQTRRCPHGAPWPGPNASSVQPQVGGCACLSLGLPSHKAGWWEHSPWAGEDGGERAHAGTHAFSSSHGTRAPAFQHQRLHRVPRSHLGRHGRTSSARSPLSSLSTFVN